MDGLGVGPLGVGMGMAATFGLPVTIKTQGLKKATHCGVEWLPSLDEGNIFICKARVPVKKTSLKRPAAHIHALPTITTSVFFALVWAALETRIGIFTMMDVGFNVG